MSENDLQRAVAKVLDYSGLAWCHVPNGGNRSAKTGALMKAMGAKAGVPDVLIFDALDVRRWDRCGLAIELKVGKNKPTPAQVLWMERLRDCGWRCEVCYTLDEVMSLIRECYHGRIA